LTRLEITYDPLKLSLFESANNAYDVGLLAKGQPRPVLTGIFDITQLNGVLSEKGLPPVDGGAASTTIICTLHKALMPWNKLFLPIFTIGLCSYCYNIAHGLILVLANMQYM
jgi:hypothetical protein